MQIPFLNLKTQYESIKLELNEAIASVISSSGYVSGKFPRTFEEVFADYHQAAYCVGVGNGTDAIEIALEALDMPAGSDIIVPANSFIATAEAVTRTGHKVVFCDCDSENYTLSVKDAERTITAKTKAIIPVHLYGQSCKMDEILELSKKYKLKVIEDCAQAHSAEFRGRKVGTFGDAGTFSFYPGKNLGAYGDAGAIVTNDKDLATRCKKIANHGRIAKYDHEFEGRNSRLDGLQAAILSVKLKHLDDWTKRRRAIAEIYNIGLRNSDVITPVEQKFTQHVYHLYVVRVKNRDQIQTRLKEDGIETGIHYPTPLPLLKAYNYLNYKPEDFPVACGYAVELLSLPIYPELTDEEVEYVIQKLNVATEAESPFFSHGRVRYISSS